MKKLLLILAFFGVLLFGGLNVVMAQEAEKAQDDLFEMEDTLSIDDMDPVFYEAEEGSGSGMSTTLYIVGIIQPHFTLLVSY